VSVSGLLEPLTKPAPAADSMKDEAASPLSFALGVKYSVT